MKTKLSVQILLLVLFFGLSACKTAKTVVKEHQKFLPSEISKLYLGMSLEDLKKQRDITKLTIDPGEFVTYVVEETNVVPITKFQYQFNSDKKLYEFIIFYNESLDIKSDFTNKYGKPNSGNEWLFENIDGLSVKIWVYENRLCIADAKMF